MKKRSKKAILRSSPSLTVVSVFSGCGGLDYGAVLAGCNVVFANDISAIAIDSLKSLIPDVETFVGKCGEIKHLPKADIVCGGYPCQSFSMGGLRNPEKDERTYLYKHFITVVAQVNPKYFVVENVPGLVSLDEGSHFKKQLSELKKAGRGYHVTWAKLNAADFGVPQRRKRIFLVGVRRDLGLRFHFPEPTHGKDLISYASYGAAISGLEDSADGDFYHRSLSSESNFPWYYMSRNRRASVDGPSFTIVANWRHTTLHPASPVMNLTWSNLADGWKQRWDFGSEYDPLLKSYGLDPLPEARRLTWRECSLIQTFPVDFEPIGRLEEKFKQIGNAVPPMLAKVLFEGIVSGSSLIKI